MFLNFLLYNPFRNLKLIVSMKIPIQILNIFENSIAGFFLKKAYIIGFKIRIRIRVLANFTACEH